MTYLSKITTIFLILLSLKLSAAEAEFTYIKAGKLLDVERGVLHSDQVVEMRDGRISRIGDNSEISIPVDANVIDLSAHTLLPGLIDAHVHLSSDPKDQGYNSFKISQPRSTIKSVKNARRVLKSGFTTLRIVGESAFSDVALRDAIAEGDVIGPRLMVAGPPIGITGGHCGDNNLLPYRYKDIGEGVADGPWEIRKKVRENIKYGADLIKTCSTGGVLSKGTQVGAEQYTLEELKALVDEAHMHGRKVASHAHGAQGIKNAILAGVDSIEHASFIDKEGIRLAKKHGTVLVMDIYVTEKILADGAAAGILQESLDKERMVGQTQRDNFRKAHKAGVKIAFGSDNPHFDNAHQFSRMVRFGMSPLEAIRAATIIAAELLGLADKVGTLEAGKYADIIAVSGDPLQDVSVLEKVSFVMKEGKIYKQ